MMRRFHYVSLIATALLVAAPPPASADITVDPDGPAGKQYSDSLDEARANGSGADPATAVPGATEDPPLFGEGVTAAGGSGASDGAGGDGGDGGDGRGSQGGPNANAPSKATIPDDSGHGTPLAFLIAAGVAVLGVGAAFGMGRFRPEATG